MKAVTKQEGTKMVNFKVYKVCKKGYKGYKDGLQPESLADGKLAGETKSTSVEN